MAKERIIIDGNEAAASVAYRLSEVIAIYPITPASPMGEFSDAWMAEGKPNIWGSVPRVYEMQSEAGAAGAVHGALQTGALSTTFTASQGLLLMIPNMYKIAGELTPAVLHVAARTLATHALSIFGDHSDVMATRQTGWAMLASANVQESLDMALVSHATTLESRVPFLHFFDGFRTSHELNKVEPLSDDQLRAMVSEELIRAHRERALNPDHPVLRGSAQNPDVFFQAREACNPFYDAVPAMVEKAMDRLFEVTGRRYRLYDYEGHPEAERVIVIMGSGAETVGSTVQHLAAQGEKVGVLKVRLFRPFSIAHFLKALPETVRSIAVLDRTKEPGALGEPLYQDVLTTYLESERPMPRIVGGRYGLSSKEFTPGMVKAVFDNLAQDKPRNHFTIGIRDDVTGLSLPWEETLSVEPKGTHRALFFGLGSDGTVSANKSSIKIIGEHTDMDAQGYFVYDSKKSGATTTSHLRFGPGRIRAPYLIEKADFIGCHNQMFLDRFDILEKARPGAVFLMNTPVPREKVWESLPKVYQRRIREKNLKVYAIDAASVAHEAGLGNRINTVMQVAFFAVADIIPIGQAIQAIKEGVEKAYGHKGRKLVDMNNKAIDTALDHLFPVEIPAEGGDSIIDLIPPVPAQAPDFVQRITARIIAGEGDLLPVSAFPVDGTFPTGTAQWEKRNIADEVPAWHEGICIQCNKCALVCPHASIRMKVVPASALEGAPEGFKSMPYKGKDMPEGSRYVLAVAPEDCTGCGICVEICPAKSKTEVKHKAIDMTPKGQVIDYQRPAWDFFVHLPEVDRTLVKPDTIKGSQLLQPLFEFSGACSGCGETPYIKLVTQMFGDRTLIANATGCSSIYGGNLPTTPYTQNPDGRGPAWSNSLFEDNAEFGLGMRLAADAQRGYAEDLVRTLAPQLGDTLVDALLAPADTSAAGLKTRREQIVELRSKLQTLGTDQAKALDAIADSLVPRSVWIIGGDGWAYDIGYGGLDHVIASGLNVNVLVLDTEVYSNTGGQMSKATPIGAVAKFAAGGKPTPKKDLAMMAMAYGNVYVAKIAMGANDTQTVKAIAEAESYPGTSLIIAYSHCIAHGINITKGMEQQDLAVKSGHWPLMRFDPRREAEGKQPLSLDSKAPSVSLADYIKGEGRYRMLMQSRPEVAEQLHKQAEADAHERFRLYEALARGNK